MPAIAQNARIDTIKKRLDLSRLPAHVAIITDGNGRWAKRRGMPRIYGHGEGYKTVRQIVRDAGEIGIRVLTLYVFSVENWKRPKTETDALMRLIEQAARSELRELHENNVQIRFLGRREGLPDSLIAEMDRATAQTAKNTGLILNLAVNYGGRAELADGVRSIARKVAAGEIDPEAITEETIAAHTYAPDLPDPDLLIRTAGEMRFSNFLLWGSAYAEFWVTQTLWPDFTTELLADAIVDFQGRVRKFGMVVDP
ncbi:MAG: isoprenyl transferase [Capsulimonadaceae bacterium]|nr:isoprenyl transferase [Capsulimonadaceae bacterium]